MQDLTYYQNQADILIDQDLARDTMFDAMDQMYQNRWSLPSALSNLSWIHKVVDTGPHDALYSAARVLSTVEPKITYYPLDNRPQTKERCAQITKALAWHYKRASRRSVGSVTKDIVMSALRYDEIALQVVYIPWQKKVAETLKSRIWETAGDFAVIVHNPRDVHVKRSVYGVEAVLLCREMTAEDITALWGEAGTKAIEILRSTKTDKKTGLTETQTEDEAYTYYDWTDRVNRVIWIVPSDIDNEQKEQGGELVYKGEHKLKFIPWVNRMGGTALDNQAEYKRHPLLASIYQAGQWETVNTLKTLEMSKAISTSAAPITVSQTMSGEAPEVDYTQPGGNVPLRQGENWTNAPTPQLDPRMRELTQQTAQAMGNSTVPRILQSAEFPSGAAFASLNTMLRSASAVLDPYRTTAELALSDMFTQMLLWVIESGQPLFSYDMDKASKTDQGAELLYKVDPSTIDPENIYIEVELSANLPLDKMSELNAATLYVQQLGLSKERALQMLDHTNAADLIAEGIQEAFIQTEVQNRLKMIQARVDLEIQRMQQEQQMQMQQQQMAAQQQAQQPGPSPEGLAAQAAQQQGAQAAAGLTPEQQMQAFGQVFPEGQAMNPAMGGMPPQMAAPGITREVIQGRGQNGEPLANM